MFHQDIDNLYFIGLFQPLGCIWPLADYQALLACMEITGKYQRPADMKKAIADELANPHFDFIKTPRHSTEVDYANFREDLLKELNKADVKAYKKPEDFSVAHAA